MGEVIKEIWIDAPLHLVRGDYVFDSQAGRRRLHELFVTHKDALYLDNFMFLPPEGRGADWHPQYSYGDTPARF